MSISEEAKELKRAYQREWYEKNKEKIREQRRKNYESNKDMYRKHSTDYWERKAMELTESKSL